MDKNTFKPYDFDHPSLLFVLEDKLKGLLGGPLLYNPYFRTFDLKGNERVLDFGCGGGAGSKCLVRSLREGQLTCVDTSKYWINRARKRLRKHPNAESIVGDIRKLNIPDATFDVIVAIHVIHEIAPDERRSTVQTLARTLKPGGALYLRELTKASHGMPAEEIRGLFGNAGLKEFECRMTKSEYMGKYVK